MLSSLISYLILFGLCMGQPWQGAFDSILILFIYSIILELDALHNMTLTSSFTGLNFLC